MPEDLFALFDPDEEVAVTRRNLPHWQQAGKTYFITFRTADSLPRPVLDAWYEERSAWLKRRGIAPGNEDLGVAERRATVSAALARLPLQERREFHRTFSEKMHRLLDDCHGECVLKRPALAKIVGESLLHFDGDRYEMGDYVVMPNHVHMLVQFRPEVILARQCESWKHYTAVRINRALRRTGHFWQGESFDHLVRSPEQFDVLRRYIADNPLRANLREGEFLHYVRK